MSAVLRLAAALGNTGDLVKVYFNCGLSLPHHFLIGEDYTIGLLGFEMTVPATRCFTLERHCQVFEEWPEIEALVEGIIARRGYHVGMYQIAEIGDAPPGLTPMERISFIGTYRNRGA